MSESEYNAYLKQKSDHFENICKRCGECCGSQDDPCTNLVKQNNGTYFCKDYENRLKKQQTISGKTFTCVSIREHIAQKTLRSGCAYKEIC